MSTLRLKKGPRDERRNPQRGGHPLEVGRTEQASDPAPTVCDLMKALRSEWLTVEGLVKSSGLSEQTTRKWVEELEAQGFIVARKPAGVRMAREFTLSAYWGGVAA